jgi:lysyl-tRNA synthetase class 2
MTTRRREMARARARLSAEVRRFLAELGYEEVETPCLAPAPGTEPHLHPFETRFVPEGSGEQRPLWLLTSPEYAMKRLLAEGFPRLFQIGRAFRNGEISATHNPEFTMLELYRAGTDHRGVMADLEALVEACARAIGASGGAVAGDGPGSVPRAARPGRGGARAELTAPFERLTCAEAFRLHAGVDLAACLGRDGRGDGARLHAAARAAGHDAGPGGERFEDVFFRVMLSAVEPRLGVGRPTFLVDWPAPMAALARLRTDDPRWAERFELYARGLELANGFHELGDAAEQRRRLVAEQEERRRLGLPVPPLDEAFLEAVGRMPDAGGVAVGLDRLLMLLTGAATIEDVLLFPARGFWE